MRPNSPACASSLSRRCGTSIRHRGAPCGRGSIPTVNCWKSKRLRAADERRERSMADQREGLYGRKPRRALAGYAPIPYERHIKDYVRHVNGRGPVYDEFLVEEHADGTRTPLPSDAMRITGRTIWRKMSEPRGNEGKT